MELGAEMNDGTISVNEVMDKIGYGPSPDNEADLRRYIAEAVQLKVLPEGYDPFVGADPARVDADEVGQIEVVKAIRVDTPAAWEAWAEATEASPVMNDVRPIHEVFLPVAQDIAFLARGRGIYQV